MSYNNLRAQAEPCGAWVWENQVSWYWEKETTDLRNKEKLFLEALKALEEGETRPWGLGEEGLGAWIPGSEGGGVGALALGPCSPVWASQVPTPCRACWAVSWALTMPRCLWPSLP